MRHKFVLDGYADNRHMPLPMNITRTLSELCRLASNHLGMPVYVRYTKVKSVLKFQSCRYTELGAMELSMANFDAGCMGMSLLITGKDTVSFMITGEDGYAETAILVSNGAAILTAGRYDGGFLIPRIEPFDECRNDHDASIAGTDVICVVSGARRLWFNGVSMEKCTDKFADIVSENTTNRDLYRMNNVAAATGWCHGPLKQVSRRVSFPIAVCGDGWSEAKIVSLGKAQRMWRERHISHAAVNGQWVSFEDTNLCTE